MNTVEEIIKQIKQKRGLRFDSELIADLRSTLGNVYLGPTCLSDWKRNKSIKKELLEYCLIKQISIDEILGAPALRSTAHTPALTADAGVVKTLRSPVPFWR